MTRVVFFICLLVATVSDAQVIVNVQLPPAGMLYKDQLWNLVLVNNNSSIEASVTLDIQDAATGQTVLSAVSTSFILGKGVKNFNVKDVQPVQYNYLAAELSGRYLPLGTYVACYRVIKNKEKTPIGEECVTMHITPVSLPLLNTPADMSVLPNSNPLFTWLAPGPVDMFDNLNYDLLISEILPGQSPGEAILYNIPVYTNNNLRNTSQHYPSSFSKLKPGQQYAWQVTARNGFSYSVQTEIWSFSIQPNDSLSTAASTAGYIELKSNKEPSGISYIKKAELLVKYYSFDKDDETLVRFFSADGKPMKKVKQKMIYGNNFLRFRLTNEFKKEKIYMIQVTDLKKNIYSANFSIQ